MQTPEQLADIVQHVSQRLIGLGRYDLLLKSLGGSAVIEELRIELAKSRLSPLVITSDYRFLLPEMGKEVELTPVHKAVYLFFLHHPEGIELKRLSEYRQELLELYCKTTRLSDNEKIEESIEHLINPLDNAINEKCSRIKKAFCDVMDEYLASYYIVSSHRKRQLSNSNRIWYQRLKIIILPRELVVWKK
jgi:hypothetical protein